MRVCVVWVQRFDLKNMTDETRSMIERELEKNREIDEKRYKDKQLLVEATALRDEARKQELHVEHCLRARREYRDNARHRDMEAYQRRVEAEMKADTKYMSLMFCRPPPRVCIHRANIESQTAERKASITCLYVYVCVVLHSRLWRITDKGT